MSTAQAYPQAPPSRPLERRDSARGRYPGAQPFLDDYLSRKVFFGRRREERALANQVMAQRLVVVYARSGFGKTSLLQAGIAERLRVEGFAPLFTRVNDIKRGPLGSVLDDVCAEAQRQGFEFVPGKARSLWWFFKEAQFWRDDRLLTPVLVCDQFEEIFTLNSREEREAFLSQLGELTRGLRVRDLREGSPSFLPDLPTGLSDSAPLVHVVLGIREDYLGSLEEASERIPDILHQRFRLGALGREEARAAIAEPAALKDPEFAVKAFSFELSAIDKILDFLARRRAGVGDVPAAGRPAPGEDRIEPFQLQLICQRVEEIAQRKDAGWSSRGGVWFEDLGGESGLRAILRHFYVRQIHKLPGWRVRRRARYLCGDVLISSAGRRLSVELNEIQARTKLTRDHLDVLVNARLLRADQRAENVYFELSHDSLVQPIRASRLMSRTISAAGNVVRALFFVAVASGSGVLSMLFFDEGSQWASMILLGFAAWMLRSAWTSARRGWSLIRN